MVLDRLATIGRVLKGEAPKSGMKMSRLYCRMIADLQESRQLLQEAFLWKSKLGGSRAKVMEISLNFSSGGLAILSKYLPRP